MQNKKGFHRPGQTLDRSLWYQTLLPIAFQVDMVNLLVNLKLDPNLTDKRNRSPLDEALHFQHPRVSSFLKSLGEKGAPDAAPSKPRRAKKAVDVQVRLGGKNIRIWWGLT